MWVSTHASLAAVGNCTYWDHSADSPNHRHRFVVRRGFVGIYKHCIGCQIRNND